MSYATYERCTKCAGRPQPGAVALLKYLRLKFPYTKSLGIYNCRYIGGTSTLSNHACGCAIDLAIPRTSSGGPRPELGNPVVQFLSEISSTTGMTEQIYNRVRYSKAYPKGRYYGGKSPHYDHIHMSISKAKGLSLTYAQIVAVAGQPTSGAPIPEGEDEMSLKRGDKGKAVKEHQVAIMAEKAGSLPQFGADSDFGGETEVAVKDFQRRLEMVQTGQIDGVTSALLLRGSGGAAVDLSNYSQKGHAHGTYYAKGDHTHPAPVHSHTATTTSTTVSKTAVK